MTKQLPHSTLVKQLLQNTPLEGQVDLNSVKPLAGGVVSLILSVGLKQELSAEQAVGLLKKN